MKTFRSSTAAVSLISTWCNRRCRNSLVAVLLMAVHLQVAAQLPVPRAWRSDAAPASKENIPRRDRPASPKPWAPPEIDTSVPATSPDSCPISEILDGVAQRTQELVTNLQRFSATEELEAAELRKNGRPLSTQRAKVSYVAQLQDEKLGVSLEEYRNNRPFYPLFDTTLAPMGTAASALIFLPRNVHNFATDCEGISEVKGVRAWQIHFVQLPGVNSEFRAYDVRGQRYPVRLKGRAWIAVDTYQLLRIDHDLAESIPKLRLVRDYVQVEYRAVDFPRHDVQIWLPETSTMYVDIRGHRYRHTQRFTHYKLFWVDTEQHVTLKR